MSMIFVAGMIVTFNQHEKFYNFANNLSFLIEELTDSDSACPKNRDSLSSLMVTCLNSRGAFLNICESQKGHP
jgi:hypothetical protein